MSLGQICSQLVDVSSRLSGQVGGFRILLKESDQFIKVAYGAKTVNPQLRSSKQERAEMVR